MAERGRLYLDNAATSFPKPEAVHREMLRYATQIGATPGRANYAESIEGGRLIRRCRERIATLVNAGRADHVIFTLNTTDALNMAIKGAVRARRLNEPGRPVHLVTTELDHNSVLRPFNELAREGARERVRWTCVPIDPVLGCVRPQDVIDAIEPDTLLVAVNHVSNVTGVIQPVAQIGAACRGRDVLFLVDAAQSLGHIAVDMERMQIDLLAFPGHKGLLGPLGTGGLVIRPGVEAKVATTREGGTGSASDRDVQPETMPDRYEPGSHNALGIVGLSEGVAWLLERGEAGVERHERELCEAMIDGLRAGGARLEDGGPGEGSLREFTLLGPTDAARRVAIFSLVHASVPPAEIAGRLETQFGLLTRPGVHCAPRAHAALGTLAGAAKGALRISMGPMVPLSAVDRVIEALSEIGRSSLPPPRAERISTTIA